MSPCPLFLLCLSSIWFLNPHVISGLYFTLSVCSWCCFCFFRFLLFSQLPLLLYFSILDMDLKLYFSAYVSMFLVDFFLTSTVGQFVKQRAPKWTKIRKHGTGKWDKETPEDKGKTEMMNWQRVSGRQALKHTRGECFFGNKSSEKGRKTDKERKWKANLDTELQNKIVNEKNKNSNYVMSPLKYSVQRGGLYVRVFQQHGCYCTIK